MILCVFFLVMLIVIPGTVMYWMNNYSKYTENGVLEENT
jgi:hypothetical protein